MKRMKKTKADEAGDGSGSDSDESESSDFSLAASKKGQASNAQLKEEEVEEEEETENGSDKENSSMTSKGTSGKKVPAKQEVPKRGREDKSEREPESKKLKTPVQELGSIMEEEPQKKSHKASKKAGKADKAEKAEKAENADWKEEEKGLAKGEQKKLSRKQKKQLQEESEKPETSKETQDKVKSTPEKDKQEVAEASPPKSTIKKQGNNWSPKDEYALAKQMLEDLKAGSDFHNKPKNDSYWADLCESLKGKLEGDFSKDQIHDKHKRMKAKYEKFKNDKSGRKRNATDEELQTVFKQLFGREAAKDKDAATAKEAESNVALTLAAGIQSDGEEINEHMDTSEPGVPALEPKKQEGMHPLGQMMKDFQTAMVETMFRASMVSRQPSADPILASMTAGLPSLISSYKLGLEAASGNSEDLRRRFLEDKIVDCSTLKRKLQLLLDYYTLEQELVKKELEALE